MPLVLLALPALVASQMLPPPPPPPPPASLFCELELLLEVGLTEFSSSLLRSTLAAALPGFPRERLVILPGYPRRVLQSNVWTNQYVRQRSLQLQSAVSYTVVRVGLALEQGRLVPSAADQATRDTLIAKLGARVRGEPLGALAVGFPYVPTRSAVYTVGYQTGNNAVLIYSTTPPPALPPGGGPQLPPAPSAPQQPPPAPPGRSTLLYWLVPTVTVAVLIVCILCFVNIYCCMRLVRRPSASARIAALSPSPEGSKVRVGGSFGGRRVRARTGDASSPSTKGSSERRTTDGSDEAAGSDSDAASDGSDESTSQDEKAQAEISAGKAMTRSGHTPNRPNVTSMTSPRGRGWAASQNRANIMYEPPAAVLADARLVAGPLGKPTFALPPVQATGYGARRTISLPRGGFTDAPPPEKHRAGGLALPPPAMGPAPWIPALSPAVASQHEKRRFPPTSAAARAPHGGQQAANAAAAAHAPEQAAATARTRARGNATLRQRFGMEAGIEAPAVTAGRTSRGAAGPADSTQSSPERSRDDEPACGAAIAGQTSSCFVPKMATTSAPPPPKPTSAAPKNPKPALAKAGAKKAAKAAAAAPTPELVLAERARARVRERREQRARSELPP